MKEKLQQYALVAEIISAIAIVLSLIFVGIQVQQNSEETAANSEAIRGQVRQAMLQTDIDTLYYAGDNSLMMTTADITNLEQAVALMIVMFRSRENYWIQHRNGLLDDETYQSYRQTLLRQLSQGNLNALLWKFVSSSGEFNTGFVEEIDAALAGAGVDMDAAVTSACSNLDISAYLALYCADLSELNTATSNRNTP